MVVLDTGNRRAVESDNARISMAARLGVMDLANRNNYLMARFIEDRFKVKIAPIAPSYPLNMALPGMGLIGDLSLRHAAVAAGLGFSAVIIWSCIPVWLPDRLYGHSDGITPGVRSAGDGGTL